MFIPVNINTFCGQSWYNHVAGRISPIPQEKPPFFLRFWKEGGLFLKPRFFLDFGLLLLLETLWNASETSVFPLKNSNFESWFWKKSRLRRAHFEFPPLPTIPGGLKTTQFRSVPVCFSIDSFQRFLHLEIAVKAPQARKFWRKNSNNNDFR